MGSHVLLVALAVFTAANAQDYEEWTKAVTEEANLGKEPIKFNCSEYPVHPRPTVVEGGEEFPPFNSSIQKPVSWMLPNLTIVYETGIFDEKIEISDDKWSMTVHNVTKEDFGVYHCLINLAGTGEPRKYYLVKWGINMRGPYFEDLWEKYRMNTIIGLSACFGFTAFMVLICLVWQYRWHAPDGDSDFDKYTGNKIQPSTTGVVNHGFATNEPIATTTTSYSTATERPQLPDSDVAHVHTTPDNVSPPEESTWF